MANASQDPPSRCTSSLVLIALLVVGGLLWTQVAYVPRAAAAPVPGLSMTGAVSPASVSRVGQSVTYSFGVTNRGDVTLRGLVVRAPFPGLSALVCSPVGLGGELAAGASTICRATRTTTVPDLARTALTDTAKAAAAASTHAVNATAAVTVAVRALGPVATDDTVAAVKGGPDVFLPGATNDRSGEAGGPAVDPSRTVFVLGSDHVDGGKYHDTSEGTWSILPDGSIRFRADGVEEASDVSEVDYRVVDTAGRSAVGHLRVPIRKGPAAVSTQVDTLEGQPVTVDVLARDSPGQNPNGSPSTFDRSSLRVASVSGSLLTSFTTDQKSVTVTGVGTYAVGADGQVTFTPTAGYFGLGPTLVYAARSTAGATMTGTLTVDVDRNGALPIPVPSGPVASDDAVVTIAQLTVPLPAQANDFPGSHGLSDAGPTFPADQLTQLPATSVVRQGGRELYVPRQGVYDVYPNDPQVYFTPADGGTLGDLTPVVYEIRDTAGATSRAHLRVTVLRGPVARPEYVSTRQNQTLTVDVVADDDPGASAVGGTTAPDYGFTQLTTVGLPGATASSDQSRLTVPGEGVYTVNPGNGAVTFDPETGFRGVASPVNYGVGYTIERPQLSPVSLVIPSTLQVTVRADDPAARADTATTTAGQPVVVPVLSNDTAGSGATPLVGSSVRLRLNSELPSGSVLYGDAKTLVVPPGKSGSSTSGRGGGTFLVSGRGEITFIPTGPQPSSDLTVGYQVADANGTTTRSTLAVSVQR